MITFLEGEKWKQMRSKVTPVFTAGRLKLMVPRLNNVGQAFMEHLGPLAAAGTQYTFFYFNHTKSLSYFTHVFELQARISMPRM